MANARGSLVEPVEVSEAAQVVLGYRIEEITLA
jgi:hypothetical protein